MGEGRGGGWGCWGKVLRVKGKGGGIRKVGERGKEKGEIVEGRREGEGDADDVRRRERGKGR